jgi:hypothetical protein
MAVVLCYSSDTSLATTRRFILEGAGHRVVTAYTVEEVEEACAIETIEVAVIGQGVPVRERTRIHELVRTLRPGAKVLELYLIPIGKTLPDADDWLAVPGDAPAELAERVSALASK